VTFARAQFIVVQSFKNAASGRGLKTLLAVFGAVWIPIEFANFFAKRSLLLALIQNHFLYLFLAGIATTAVLCRPILSITYKLKNRDVSITVAIGDVFSFRGAIVIGSNTTFDVSGTVISLKSVQGKFTRKYYQDEAP
jgi:hypothetical protein